jgi:hypothetical protein
MGIRSLINKFKGGSGSRSGDRLLAPPALVGGIRFPYGPFGFKAQLAKEVSFVVEATTDLKTWLTLASGEASSEGFEYLDSEASKFSYRFYRLRADGMPPANILGYASVSLPPGFSMIANPLKGPNNTIGAMFKDWPDGTTLSKFDTRFFKLSENAVKEKKWTNPLETLLPTEGAIFYNPTSDYKSHTFVGEVVQGEVSVPIPAGFSVRSSPMPQGGSLQELGFPIANGDVIHLFDRDQQRYVLHPYENNGWKSGAPIVSVGESFWVAKTQPGNWSRKLLVI